MNFLFFGKVEIVICYLEALRRVTDLQQAVNYSGGGALQLVSLNKGK